MTGEQSGAFIVDRGCECLQTNESDSGAEDSEENVPNH